MKDSEMNILTETIEEIMKEADALLGEKKNDHIDGQLLAYATTLGIIRDCLSGYDLKDFMLDFDIDKKYLCS